MLQPPKSEAQATAEDPVFRQILWLIHNGVPFDVAHAMDFEEARAYSVTFSEFASGKKFDWDTNTWPDDE